MKTDAQIDELSAEYAKEIVIATMNCFDSFLISEESGKTVAEFYSAIFNGISETLKKSSMPNYDK